MCRRILPRLPSYSSSLYITGVFLAGSLPWNMLEYMGHTIHVNQVVAEEIIHWLGLNSRPIVWHWTRSLGPISAQHQRCNTRMSSAPSVILATVTSLINSKYLNPQFSLAPKISALYPLTMTSDTQGALPFSYIN